MKKRLLAVAVLFWALPPPTSWAKIILDVSPVAVTTLNGTATTGGGFIVTNTALQSTGTGVIDSFLRIQQTGQERGFNTDVGTPYDDKGGNFTRSLLLSEIPVINKDGVDYLEVLLDVNQVGDANISLNQVQIFQSAVDLGSLGSAGRHLDEANSSNDAVISFTGYTPKFQMNNQQNTAGGLSTNNEIWIAAGHGSGSGDMFLYVQKTLFDATPGSFITLFSQFGNPSGTYESNDGFEEWSVRKGIILTAVPEPASVAMVASSLVPLGLAGWYRRRRRA